MKQINIIPLTCHPDPKTNLAPPEIMPRALLPVSLIEL
jgi:hypothetical protein